MAKLGTHAVLLVDVGSLSAGAKVHVSQVEPLMVSTREGVSVEVSLEQITLMRGRPVKVAAAAPAVEAAPETPAAEESAPEAVAA